MTLSGQITTETSMSSIVNRQLPLSLHHYNWHHPHASLQYKPPISRISVLNNLVYTASKSNIVKLLNGLPLPRQAHSIAQSSFEAS